MYLSDTEEILVLIIGIALALGLLFKTYKDYHSMTNEYEKKIKKKEADEKYVKELIKKLDARTELLDKTAELVKKQNSKKN
ncbi:MAG: hypothetical protein P8M03_06165 [Flavobacteriaceae bacterium]|nr:hypothetical protein [Flavobacteriaceae bacterium]